MNIDNKGYKMRRLIAIIAMLILPSFSSAQSTYGAIVAHPLGIELRDIKGWFANIYPWQYFPEENTVHPVLWLWDSPKWDPFKEKYIPQYQSPAQIIEQSRQLEEYGSGADVLEFNVCPGNPDYNQWLSTYLGRNSSRPFFVLYEHINGNCNYVEVDGAKNMDLPKNRKAFTDDIEFIIKNIVMPNKDRYVTVDGRAVIYLWAATGMTGDFASLLQLMRNRYPVFFIGSVNVFSIPSDSNTLHNLRALDGFMEYGLVVFDKDEKGLLKPDNYMEMIRRYDAASVAWRQKIREFEAETRRKYIFIPTFQAAFDDTKVPGRNNPPMYPRTRAEMEHHAEVIKRRMRSPVKDDYDDVYDNLGPFVVYSEIAEGAAVIESQCLPETMDTEERFVGCGTTRLEIVKKYFGK